MAWGNYVMKELTVQGLLIYSCTDSEWNEAFNDITTWIKQVLFTASFLILTSLLYLYNKSGINKVLQR